MGTYLRPADPDIRPLVLRICWGVLGFGSLFALARWNDPSFLIFVDRFIYSLKDYTGYTPPFLLPGIFVVPSAIILVGVCFERTPKSVDRRLTVNEGLLIYQGIERLEFPTAVTTIKKDVPNVDSLGKLMIDVTVPFGNDMAIGEYKFQIRNETLKRSITILPREYRGSEDLTKELLCFEKECLQEKED
ncbi:MAG: hypothetical protein P1V97_31645 [Planctomycetota bacterium]|nr:hypothetical protein [Planctomycetota bacterium]